MWVDDASGEIKDRLLQGPQPHSNLSERDLHILGFSVSAAQGTDQVRAGFYQFLAWRQSRCFEADARPGARVAAYGPNVKATRRGRQAMQSHDPRVVELLRRFLSIRHARALSVSRPQACALGSAQIQNAATPQATR